MFFFEFFGVYAMVSNLEKVDEAELAQFKKKLKLLKKFKGKHTELISLYIPPAADRSNIMGQINEELSQSGNIKSPTTRKNVQGALRKISNFLKTIDFKIPKNGLVVFSGNVSETEGRENIQLFTVKPPKELKTKLYWCDSEFHLAPLEEMAEPQEFYGIATIDTNESTLALLVGKRYEILGHFTSGIAGKHHAGGQSSVRFARLHDEAVHEFYKRIAEKLNQVFVQHGEKIKGLLVGGPGITKNYFLNTELLDYRLKKKIVGVIDTSYTDESGIRELVQKSEDLLKDTDMVKEQQIIHNFLEQIVKTGLTAYGQKEVEESLQMGKVSTLILSEGLEWMVYKFQCNGCNSIEELVVKEPLNFEEKKYRCGKCNSEAEVIEEIDYIDFMIEKAHQFSTEIKVVSTETSEGEQFFKGFGGIGAILRYK